MKLRQSRMKRGGETATRIAPLVVLALLLQGFASVLGGENPDATEVLETLAAEGAIVGGQVAISRGGRVVFSGTAGVSAVGARTPVNAETLFLIASCSKPFASACVLRLMEDPAVADFDLEDEVGRWLPGFTNATVEGGRAAARAPTVAELLCHRAGIFSQKVAITREQAQLLYTFEHSLEETVDAIVAQPLLAPPGERYAYSGAGYCVLGRVAELAAGRSMESLLQKQVCAPLGLKRTTYFPVANGEKGVFATGFAAARAPHALGERHRFPLVGGSLYSTAGEMVRFAQGVGGFVETASGEPFLSPEARTQLEVVRNPGKGYTLGWSVLRIDGKVVRLSHSGSLQGYRSWMALDRRSETCVAAVWTLPDIGREGEAKSRIREALTAALDGP